MNERRSVHAPTAIRRRAEVYADGELEALTVALKAFVDVLLVDDVVDDQRTRQAAISDATLEFCRVMAESLTTSFLVGHAAGCAETVKPAWMDDAQWRGRKK